ncbi:MAG: hypothetical protein WA728_26325, partial [Xanthobacteraceae bacterium]
ALTRAERRLVSEIEKIASIVGMDFWNIEKHYERESWPSRLKLIRDGFVRSDVILKYTLIDEFLTDMICDYYFRRPNKKRKGYRQLWRTKPFRIFVHYLMDETFLLKKLMTVEAITKVPSDVSKAIKRINDVRNALAHSFFPENRRRYMADKKVLYKGAHLFTAKGVELFQEDYEIAENYLWEKVFG